MALLQKWRDYAYSEEMQTSKEGQKMWEKYFTLEKGIYEQLLSDPENIVSGTVKELSEKYDVPLSMMVGFLDGINDSLKTPNPIDEMEEDTVVSLDIDLELLYKNMIDNDAEWLYNLPQWDELLDDARRKELYKEQKSSRTYRREQPKVGRNDPCPCGSGKKYKHCCGKSA
ncbi:MAG: SEC-C domain-containing protein [Eubacterium sp.]|nr:SEC-C domain-containing protein [Eubacterium sp.]